MAKKGVSKISGNTAPVIGEKTTYQVSEWYAGTAAGQRNSSLVTWELFKKRRNGTFTTTHIRKKGVNHFTFGQVAAGETYRLEAYLFHPEGRGLVITPKPAAVPKIKKVELLYVDNSKGTVFSFFEKLRAQATCVNMLGKELVFTLWEDDKTGPGHHAGNQPIESKKARVNKNGIAMAEFALTAALMRQAAKGELDSQLEFYVTVEYYANKKHATNNVHVANPYYTAPAANPAPAAPKSEQNLPAPAAPAPTTPAKEKEENIKDVPQTQPADSQQASGTATVDQPPTNPILDGKSDAVVKHTKIEGIIDAYFAKKDFTKLTGQEAGNYTYTFGGKKAANNTSNAANKEKVANAILSVAKVNEKLKTEKKYTTKEAIVSALTAAEYGTDTTSHKTVTFKTFALGEEFKKIGSAPLEEKVYLVVSTYLLQEKNATITVKEKDGIIQGSAGAALPISQISEAKMNSTEALTEADRTEKTTFTGALAKVETGKDAEGKPISSEMLAIPVQLCPKSDDDLAKWKEKLSKGWPDGTYTYTFKNSYGVVDVNKAELAAAIVKNATNGSHGNPKLESGKTAHADDVKKALETKTYASGATVTFPVYRKETEMLWLEVSATGSKEHKKEFLKGEGGYFEIGRKCARCDAEITLQQIEILFGKHSRSSAFRQEVVNYLNQYIQQNKNSDKPIHINTCLRKAHFFAQVGAETQGINTDWIVETDVVPYQASNITANLFGNRAVRLRNKGLVELYCAERPQVKLLNYLYAAENGFGNGNGNEASGDGFKFRGRGLKQLTGRGNYRVASATLKEIFPNEYQDFEVYPEKLKEAKYAVLSAIAYWEKNKIWQTADQLKISTDENIKAIRRTVNVGAAGWKDAKKYFNKGMEVFNVLQCEIEEDAKIRRRGYDIDKAVQYIIANAKTKKPYGACALYVRRAINAGGISGSWGDAWQYISALPKIGFIGVGKVTNFQKGDIVVFDKTGNRKWGHIAMWTGTQWISDFKQNSILVHNDYIGKDYYVFRWQ